MGLIKKFFAIVALSITPTALVAMPILSADGSSLTGVDVGGTLYDVSFGDGIVVIVYADVTFDAAREAEANAVSAAIAAALNSIGGIAPDMIAGCSAPGICFLFNPNTYDNVLDGYEDDNPIRGAPGTWTQSTTDYFLDSGTPTSVLPDTTLVTYRPQDASIPVPAPIILIGLGLGLLVGGRAARVRS